MNKKSNIPKLRFEGFEGEWEINKINNLTNVTSGGTPSTLKKEYWNGNIPWMNSGELNLKLVYDVENRITELGLNKSSTKFIPKKSILIGLAGQGKTRGTAAMNMIELCINQSIGAILPNKEKFISEFLYLNIDSRYDELRKLSTGDGGRGGLNLQILKSLKVSIPTLPEQQKIASFLSAVDEKIQQLSRKKELLEQYKKGVMQQLFSGKLRFKDEKGNEYPDWEEKKLGKVCDVRDGTHDSPKYVDKGFPFITSKNLMKDGSIDFDNVSFINENDYNKVNQRSKVNINDILFGMIGTIGNPVLVKSEGFAIKNVALIKEKKDLLNPFLIHFLKGDSINQQFFKQNTGGTQKFLSLSVIRNLVVIVPTIPEQQKIANFLSSIDAKIENTNSELEKTQGFKKGLLQQLFV